jgi:actin-related protein
VSGGDVTDYTLRLLQECDYRWEGTSQTSRRLHAARIKEQLCFVRAGAVQPLPPPDVYTLPDGTEMVVDDQRARGPEVLFDPKPVLGEDRGGLVRAVVRSVTATDADLRGELLQNVALVGAGGQLRGLAERVLAEVQPQALWAQVRVKAPPGKGEAANMAWRGGCVAGLVPGVIGTAVSAAEYEESGETIVHRKFL